MEKVERKIKKERTLFLESLPRIPRRRTQDDMTELHEENSNQQSTRMKEKQRER